MQIVIDTQKIKESELDLDEFLMLLGIKYGYTINSTTHKRLGKLNYICIDSLDEYKLPKNISITLDGNAALEGILSDCKISKIEADKYEELAEKMIALFPKGRKPGTNYMWRGSKLEIARKLKTLATKYGVQFDDDKVLEATESYIKSFNGDYRTMRLLKYFIFKIEVKDGKEQFCSELLERIENLGQENLDREDWTTTLC